MNQNKITNIIERGGVDNWETASDLAHLKRTFTFTSFEQAQAFCQSVGKYCSKKDHHPEWSLSDNGRSVNVKLTSHFAGNKVTLLDFELAENMNEQFQIVQHDFKMFPLFTEKNWASFKLLVFGSIFVIFCVQTVVHWGRTYPLSEDRGDKPQSAQFRPLIIAPFTIYNSSKSSDLENEAIAKAHIDAYAFKTHLFVSKSAF